MTATPQMKLLAAAIQARVPAIMWGAPGIGKTATVASHAAEWNMDCEVVVGSVREASDFLGLPIEVNGQVVYSPPSWAVRLNEAKRSLLFLDEFTTSAPSVQKAMLRVLQERHVGEYALGEQVSIIAAANPPDVAVDGWELPAPIANRFLHIDWASDSGEWLEGLATDFDSMEVSGLRALAPGGSDTHRARAAQIVTGFLRHRPDMREPGVPTDDSASMAWASRRSWHNLVRVLSWIDTNDDALVHLAASGLVGAGAAIELTAWLQTADLADPEAVLADPYIVDWAEERPDKLFALVTSVSALAVMRGDEPTWTAAVQALTVCAEAGRPDVALPGMRPLVGRIPEDAKLPNRAREAFADLFGRTGAWAA